MGPIVNKRIEELGFVNPLGNSVISVSTSDKAIDAFIKMFYHKVNAVAVIDSLGCLAANLSASDLRGLDSNSLKYLNLPPLEFLQAMTGTYN